MKRNTGVGFVAGLALALVSCTERPSARATPERWDGVTACDYGVRVARPAPLALEVEVSCRGKAIRGFEADDARVADAVRAVASSSEPTTRRAAAFLLSRPVPRATFRYTVELGELARGAHDLNLALASGDSVIAAASSFLLYPLPLDVGIETKVRFHVAEREFTTALAREGDHYRLEAHEIAVGTYSAFGKLARQAVALAASKPATVELTLLDGEFGLGLPELLAFTRERAQAVADFYGEFPAERASVMVVPVRGRDEIIFGKLLPESAPGVVLLAGSATRAAKLRDDWVLVHELFHIGVPSFDREGKWYDEGLATYFEPIIRVRAGLYDEARAWGEFVSQMPRGLPALTRHGLDNVRDNASVYWGGALFCLLADVQVRRDSAGARGLEDGLRRVLAAGGRSSEVWELATALATADAAFVKPVLAPLFARFAKQPSPVDLDALFAALGVQRTATGIAFDDAAPLAAVRRAIFSRKQTR